MVNHIKLWIKQQITAVIVFRRSRDFQIWRSRLYFINRVLKKGSAEEAIKQIDEKGYLSPYAMDTREKIKVGVDFSKEKRNINHYIFEVV